MNELPDFAQTVAPFAVQNSVYIAAQDSTGFVAKMNMLVGLTNTHIHVIAIERPVECGLCMCGDHKWWHSNHEDELTRGPRLECGEGE
jgi:hypothetical protein